MHPRVFGLETEYVLNFVPGHPAAQRPDRRTVCDALICAVSDARPTGLPKIATALSNGGFLHYESQVGALREGFVEAASPECRSPRDVVVWSAAQDRLLAEAVPDAERLLAARGYVGEIVLGKNNLGYEGHSVGSHENYWVEDRGAWWRVALRLMLFPPIFVLQAAVHLVLWSVLLAVVLLIFTAMTAAAVVGLGARVPVIRWSAAPTADAILRRLHRLDGRLDEAVLKIIAFTLYRVGRPMMLLFSAFYDLVALAEIRRGVAAHLVSRTVFTGAGALALDSAGCPAGFLLSQRADRLVRFSGIFQDEPGRPFIDTKQFFFEPLALFRRRKRLHIICGDSNMSETAEWLRFGTTDLVLRLAEAGRLEDAPRLRDPVGAIRTIARDPSLRVEVDVRGRGRMTALDLQRFYLDRAAETFGHEGGDTAAVLRTWRQVLDRLERDPASARG
ncbi:MAG: proteasome accessory factor PafA2 family protein, partial [Planctomycetota bacterium]